MSRGKRLSYTLVFFSVILALLILAIFVFSATKVSAYYFGQRSLFITVSIVMLIVFLFILLMRYFFLLWFSFFHYVERVSPLSVSGQFTVTVLVPAYNEEKVIEASLRSILSQDYPFMEVIVIDDGSTDRTYEIASRFVGRYGKVRVRVVRQPNRGKAGALNLGIAAASGDLILCIDADSQLAPHAVSAMAAHFTDPKIAAVAGNVKVRNRVNLWTKLQALEYIEGLNLVRQAQSFFRSVNIIPGPIGMFRRDVLLAVGGYESDTFAEDADLTLKLVNEGYAIAYEPQAVSFTEAPEALLDLVKQRYRWTRGILQSMKKRPEMFFKPWQSLMTFAILWYMLFEAVIWPMMNIFANVFLVGMNLAYGMAGLLVFWVLQLTILDVVAALHCITFEREDLKLVPYAVLYRIFFILIIDFCKVLATAEEVLGVPMKWGKLTRYGAVQRG